MRLWVVKAGWWPVPPTPAKIFRCWRTHTAAAGRGFAERWTAVRAKRICCNFLRVRRVILRDTARDRFFWDRQILRWEPCARRISRYFSPSPCRQIGLSPPPRPVRPTILPSFLPGFRWCRFPSFNSLSQGQTKARFHFPGPIGGSFRLEQTYNLSPPVQWTTVVSTPVLRNGFWMVAIPTTNGTTFYRRL